MKGDVKRSEGKSGLLPQHAELISKSGISQEVAAARGYRSVETRAELRRLGFSAVQARVPALLIPIWGVDGEIVLYQARPDEPRVGKGKRVKYETPRGTRMALDVPPLVRSQLGDPKRPLFVTEGVRKADAAVSKDLCCIALLGVWNWRGTNGAGGKTALPDWEEIALNDRQTFIVFDSDVTRKSEVKAAMARLKLFLESRGAKVLIVYLPPGPTGEKVGLDDYLATGHGVDDLLRLADSGPEPRSMPDLDASPRGPYQIEDGRICFVKETGDGPVSIPLCNFVARVAEEIVLDDGCETTRAFVIEGALDSGKHLSAIRVSADKFGGMTWPTSSWGLDAVVAAGLASRDRLREAIQRLSPNATRRQVFTHTGWRQVNGTWRYLTAAGAVGAEGFEVELGPDLGRYSLPRASEDPASAMRTSLNLLQVAPLSITAPLWAGVFRGPLASAYPLDLSLWLEGITGSLKSTFAALFLSHWGPFDRTKLPGAWSSTANSLERRAFILKDAMFVIDDYAPSAVDRRDLEAKAARLLRAQGNLAGRGRLRSDLSERPGYAPRGLVVCTGEQLPPGQSIRARMLVVEIDRSTVKLDLLTAAQAAAARLPHALAGYVDWLAPQIESLGSTLRATFESVRLKAVGNARHLRIPEVLGHLWIGVDCGLAYAEDIGACDAGQAKDLRAQCWEALIERAEAQGQGLEEERPTRRFLTIISTLAQQQRVLLLPRDHFDGTGRHEPPLLGWFDSEFLYLLPEASFQAATKFAREGEEPFAINQRRLRQDLVREEIAVPDAGRTTATVRVGGSLRRVLRLRNTAVEAAIGEELPFSLPIVTAVTSPGE